MARSVSPVGQRVTWHVQAAVPTAQVNADETVFVGEDDEPTFDLTRRRGKIVCGVFVPESARFPGKVW